MSQLELLKRVVQTLATQSDAGALRREQLPEPGMISFIIAVAIPPRLA
jgi:hypothetical protein